MPLAETREEYEYRTTITSFDDECLAEAQATFNAYKEKNIIRANSFEDPVWTISNQIKTRNIDFRVNEIMYKRNCERVLCCTYNAFVSYFRIYIANCLGYTLDTLQEISRDIRRFVETYPDNDAMLEILKSPIYVIDFINTLPSSMEIPILEEFELLVAEKENKVSRARRLATYQSYLRFDTYFTQFWTAATEREKLIYFPIYLWWKITAILPLRPTEFTLMPRNCLHRKGEQYILTLRRTRLKKKRSSVKYNINKDFELCTYSIPAAIALEIEQYIKKTENCWSSDICTLFVSNGRHFTYFDLHNLLLSYYRILCTKNELKIVERQNVHTMLNSNEIERLCLGDTRHVAMINLIANGGSPVICKELAHHESINVSSNYYCNIENFVEALSIERYQRIRSVVKPAVRSQRQLLEGLQLHNGLCISPAMHEGKLEDCLPNMGPDGQLMDCSCCKFFIHDTASGNTTQNVIKRKQQASTEMRKSFDGLLYAIEMARKARGDESTIGCALRTMQANALQYGSIFEKMLELNGG